MDLVFLHGRAASGKLTTARALEQLVGYPVFHNHLVVDLLTPLFQFGSDAFVRLREQFWMAVFREAATADRSVSFTFTPEHTVPAGFAQRVQDVVERAGGRVCFVRLTVGDAERERRVTLPSRREFYKLADVATLRRHLAQPEAEQPPTDLEIDTTTSAPHDSAARIVEYFELPPRPRAERYPVEEASR
jgi:chloramphenicol 3-O-phosphotransferase